MDLRNNKILIIGTTVLDILVQKSTNKAYIMTGGKGYNIATNISTLGGPVSLSSSIGKDEYSKKIRVELKNNSIKLVSPSSKENVTGVYFSLFDGSSEPIFDANRIPRLTDNVLPKDISKYQTICVISGVENSVYVAISKAKKVNNNIKFCVSLSGRKSVDEVVEYVKNIDLLLCNKKEAVALIQKIDSAFQISNTEACLDILCTAGVRAVVITDGENGIYFKDKEGDGKIKAVKVNKVVSALGAGDSVVATVLYEYISLNKPLIEACKTASLISAKVVSQKSSLILKTKKI
ncbi:MAG: carbohydrate kinase family protein [bacterium]|nr:carbohydrate kinase family protein [bacterium]